MSGPRAVDVMSGNGTPMQTARVDQAIAAIAAGAAGLDREPRFPREAFAELAAAGVLAATIGAARTGASVAPEWALLRRVAAADAAVGRILDGHLNAIERLEVAADPDLRDRELTAVEAGERLLGVWGADPAPDEGPPARLVDSTTDRARGSIGVLAVTPADPAADERDADRAPAAGGLVLRGVKTFCSGAGGVDAAMVMVRSDDGTAPALVLVECDERVEVDRSWYRAAGLRASESHRVVFHDAPVIAILGGPGELARDPWFSRDAMRTAATWAGMVDAAASAALDDLSARRAEEPLAQLAAGRIEAARGTVEAWLDRAAHAADASLPDAGPAGAPGTLVRDTRTSVGGARVRATGIAMRAEIDRAAKAVLAEAAAACGSHPFVTAGRLDRARRDLETFLLQHRLDPLLTRLGGELLGGR